MGNLLFSSWKLILILFTLGIVGIGVGYATINYFELFPNGSSLYQSQNRGWVTPTSSTSKEIMTPEGCKKVTGGATTNRYFIPTKTLAEWNSFKNHLPGGSNITECPISGVCGGSSNSCSVGTPSGYNPGSCGGSETWTCLGQYGGANTSCSIANPPCPTPINGLCNNAYAGFSPGVPCFAGTSSSYNAGSCGGSATWMCLGQNGGTNDSCNHTNPPCPPTNGVCGGTKNSCTAGSFVDFPDSTTSYLWQCKGLNGGSDSPLCSVPLDSVACSFQIHQFYLCDICGGVQQFIGPPSTPCLRVWGPLGYQEWPAYSAGVPDRATIDSQCKCPTGCTEISRVESNLSVVAGSCTTAMPGTRNWNTTVTCSCP